MWRKTVLVSQHKRSSAAVTEPWKGQRPQIGNWKGEGNRSPDRDPAGDVGFIVVSVKLRPAENEELEILCAALGITRHRAMRAMVRRAAGFLESDADQLRELRAITRQLNGVATNINQIAKAGNRTGNPDLQQFMAERKAMGPELARLQSQLQRVLDIGARRTDGLARLQAAVAAE